MTPVTLEFIKKFAYWCPLWRSMFYTWEDYQKAKHELFELAKEYPEVMKNGN